MVRLTGGGLLLMSIMSSICADIANEKRDEWIASLEEAFALQDWDLVQMLILTMENFRFDE